MDKINEKQKKINESIKNYNFFNPDGFINLKQEFEAPLDTLNKSNNKIQFNTTKSSNKTFNPMVEEQLRVDPNGTNFHSQLFSLNTNLATNQQQNNTFFSELSRTNSNAFVQVDEKLKFNNHSRLY